MMEQAMDFLVNLFSYDDVLVESLSYSEREKLCKLVSKMDPRVQLSTESCMFRLHCEKGGPQGGMLKSLLGLSDKYGLWGDAIVTSQGVLLTDQKIIACIPYSLVQDYHVIERKVKRNLISVLSSDIISYEMANTELSIIWRRVRKIFSLTEEILGIDLIFQSKDKMMIGRDNDFVLVRFDQGSVFFEELHSISSVYRFKNQKEAVGIYYDQEYQIIECDSKQEVEHIIESLTLASTEDFTYKGLSFYNEEDLYEYIWLMDLLILNEIIHENENIHMIIQSHTGSPNILSGIKGNTTKNVERMTEKKLKGMMSFDTLKKVSKPSSLKNTFSKANFKVNRNLSSVMAVSFVSNVITDLSDRYIDKFFAKQSGDFSYIILVDDYVIFYKYPDVSKVPLTEYYRISAKVDTTYSNIVDVYYNDSDTFSYDQSSPIVSGIEREDLERLGASIKELLYN